LLEFNPLVGFLWTSKHGRNALFPRLVLFNVRYGARWDIHTTFDEAKALIEGVLRAKYTAHGQTPLDVFLRRCEGVRGEVEAVVEKLDLSTSDGHSNEVVVKRSRRANTTMEHSLALDEIGGHVATTRRRGRPTKPGITTG
jgi:hypothetical protein